MVAGGRPGAGRQKEGALFLQRAKQMPCRGSSYFSTIYFSLRWSESKKGSFSFFCVPLVAALGLLGQPLLPACPGGARKREKRAPLSIGLTSRLSLRGNTAEESLQGIKHNPAVRGVKVKHQPDGL